MKSKILITLGVVACLCFGACSLQDTEVLHNEPEQESSSLYTPVSLDYEVQKLPQDTMDIMSANGFRWGGRGAPELAAKWKGDNEVLFFLYRIDPFLPSNSMRIFSYQLSTNTLSFLTEIAEYDLTGTYFQQREFSYLCLNHPSFAKVCRIGNGTAEIIEVDSWGGEISPTGELAKLDLEDSSVTISDFLNQDLEQETTQFHVGDQEEYVSWSPDSRYLAFYQSDNSRYAGGYRVLHLCDDSQYTIYDREGNVAYSGAADGFHWCEEPDFFTLSVSDGGEKRWKLISMAEGGKYLLPAYPEGDILLQEPDFALIMAYGTESEPRQIVFVDHKTGEWIPVEEIDLEDSQFEAVDYNRDTRTAALVIWEEEESEGITVASRPVCYQIHLFENS